MKKHIPNGITLLNLCCGVLSIISEDLFSSAIFIFIAAVLDVLDGAMARWLDVYSSLGAQLDSLADLVSFGLAPSILLYRQVDFIPAYFLTIAICLVTASAAYRLAIFNISEDNTYFMGLPTPASGLAMVGLSVAAFYESSWAHQLLIHPWWIVAIMFALAFLMNSPIPLFSLKKVSLKGKRTLPYIFLLLGIVGVLFVSSIDILWLWVPLYILSSWIFKEHILRN